MHCFFTTLLFRHLCITKESMEEQVEYVSNEIFIEERCSMDGLKMFQESLRESIVMMMSLESSNREADYNDLCFVGIFYGRNIYIYLCKEKDVLIATKNISNIGKILRKNTQGKWIRITKLEIGTFTKENLLASIHRKLKEKRSEINIGAALLASLL